MMKSGSQLSLSRVLLILTVLFISAIAFAAGTLDSINLLKISPQDERAVARMEDGTMKIIKPGGTFRVRSTHLTIREIEEHFVAEASAVSQTSRKFEMELSVQKTQTKD